MPSSSSGAGGGGRASYAGSGRIEGGRGRGDGSRGSVRVVSCSPSGPGTTGEGRVPVAFALGSVRVVPGVSGARRG